MRTKLLAEPDRQRTYAVVMDKGDDPIAELGRWARENSVGGASLTGVGAFRRAVVAFFDPVRKEYLPTEVNEQAEVLSLIGDIAESGGSPALHVHVVLGLRDTSTRGGHLMEADVWPTLEVMVTEAPTRLRKHHDTETGLALINPDADDTPAH